MHQTVTKIKKKKLQLVQVVVLVAPVVHLKPPVRRPQQRRTSHTSVASAPPSTTAAGSVSSSMHNATPSSAAAAGTAASAGDATFSANTPHTIHVLNGSQASKWLRNHCSKRTLGYEWRGNPKWSHYGCNCTGRSYICATGHSTLP